MQSNMASKLSKSANEIVIQYHPPALAYGGIVSRLAIATLLSFAIPWALFSMLFAVVSLLIFWLHDGLHSEIIGKWLQHLPALLFFAVYMAAAISAPLVMFFTMLLADRRLRISKRAITFPLIFLPWLSPRLKRRWSEIKEIQLPHTDNKPDEQARIRLQLDSKVALPLRLDYFSQADSDQLVGLIDSLASNCLLPCALTQRITDKNGLDLSFTQIWEEELASRIGNTTFIPLEVGTFLQSGRIRIIRQLSGNGRAASYLGRLLEQKLVVVKEVAIPPTEADMPTKKTYEQFQRECSYLVRLDHPRITRVLDHFVENSRTYLLLGFIPGIDLRQYVNKEGPVPENKVLDWALQVASILEYLHSNKPPIIHRDITPDNLVLGEDGLIYLIDFGVANELVANVTGTLVGKQAYMAPEQVRGKATSQSDIYSLGATMYFLSTGQEPQALTTSRPRAVSHSLSDHFNQLVAYCTEIEIAHRCQSAFELANHISKLVENSAPMQAK